MTEAEVVEKYRPFVIKTARKFNGSGVPEEDLIQEGLIAVVKAYREWRSDGGASFLTWIRQPVHRALQAAVAQHKACGVTANRDPRTHRAVPIPATSMDEEDSDGVTLHDTLAAPASGEGSPDTLLLAQLTDAMSVLDERERKIVRLRYEQGFDLERIGGILKVSRERVRQIERDALAKLRRYVRRAAPDA